MSVVLLLSINITALRYLLGLEWKGVEINIRCPTDNERQYSTSVTSFNPSDLVKSPSYFLIYR